jgi:protein TIF31
VQDLRQTIVDQPNTLQYSCFHLEHNGERINDFVELSEVPGLQADSELTLVEDPYTEKEARWHVIRVRELIGAAGDRTDSLHGVLSGISLHDDVSQRDVTKPGSSSDSAQNEGDASAVAAYDFEAPASVKTLLPAAQQPAPKTIKSLSVSPWNPPPYHLRAKGHLLYLHVITIEGEQHHITAHVGGFYVSRSSHNKFDPFPRPSPKECSAHSLLTLLSKLSPGFDNAFRTLQEHNSKRDLLTVLQLPNAAPANPWLVPSGTKEMSAHQPDIARTQETYLIAGVENTDTLRDWNEEFQSTREMTKEAVQDRVFRERLTSKLFADFNEAATRGAMAVARGEVAPLNPTESKDAQIFVYNNIFFSFGADGVGTFATEGGDEAARVATGKDAVGVRAVNNLDIQGLFTPGTVVVDYLGKRIVCQSIVPGIFKQREPGEHQIDYGGVEGKDVVAAHEGFVPLFDKMSKALRVKKHPVWDKEGVRHVLEGSVETKGLIGTDGRKYALDLYRITPLDVSWLEQYWSERGKDGEVQDKVKNYPHRMAVLRPELVESFGRLKLREYVKDELAKKSAAVSEAQKEIDGSKDGNPMESATAENGNPNDNPEEKKEPEQERVDISGFNFSLNPDVFSGQIPQSDEDKEEMAKDEAEVRAACNHLQSDVIPTLVSC